MGEAVSDTQHANAGPVTSQLRIGRLVAGGRLQVLETLGRGGMGVVYQAFDATRRCTVALKTMHGNDAVSIYALKNEFRALAGVHHPNLVRLFELYCEEDNMWFFTMELVRGERFDRWVRPGGKLDERRLRHALPQLLDGIAAVHAAGKLHRDIKPSNVLVTNEGHVVVLDFGLVTEPSVHAVGETLSNTSIVGTPAYLAPELVLGSRASVATDLYAIGVMLFEALTGQLPFEGSAVELLIAKQQSAHSWPPSSRRALPADLVTLCDMLLTREPGLRPDMATLLAHFARDTGASAIPPSGAPLRLSAAELVGREPELARLRTAYASSLLPRPVAVFVSGESGIGKTALCNTLADELAHEGHAVVLRGRCNEHESVPFKALDSLVDDLSRHLRRLRPEQAAALMPRDAAALTTLFPVLSRVDVLAEAPARPATDPHEQLRRAFAAFHELLARLRDRTPLVIQIDDLQWTDRDSTLLLRYLLLHPEPVAALVIFSHRSEPGERELLDIVREAAQTNREIQVEHLQLEPLPQDASNRLARRWLAGSHARQARTMTEKIEREAHGNPFLIGEFARFVALQGEIDSENLSLHVVLDARLATMSQSARKLLLLLTLAGQPMATDLLLAAAGATHADVDVAQAAHLVRSIGKSKLEFYHDRIRERLRESIAPDEMRRLYADLARMSAESKDVETDMRCAYLEGAGNRVEAATCAAAAADQAATALAFDHAARLYRKALELGTFDRDAGMRLTRALAQALENAGRSVESAAAYKRSALLAHGEDNLELRTRGAGQLLAAGHANEGLAALEAVCAEMHLRLPTQAKLSNVSLAWALGLLRFAGPTAERKPVLSVSSEDRRRALRLDVLQTAYIGLQCYSQVSAAPLAFEYLREAQRCGDARHIVWALGSLGMVVSDRALYRELLVRMDAIATTDGRPELRGLVCGLRGFVAGRAGEHGEARAWFAKALAAYADCVGMQWQIDLVHVYDQLSASIRGEYSELARTTPALIDEAFQHGRAWTGAMLTGFWSIGAWLAFDDACGYRRHLERAFKHWSHLGASLTADRASWGLHRAEVMLSIYEGAPLTGYELLARRANAPMKPTHRRDHRLLRSACCVAALGAARAGQLQLADRRALREEARLTDELRRAPQFRANAHLIEAALAIDEGRKESAERELRTAERLFESSAMPVLVAGTRRRLGQLIGGEEGRQLITTAEAFLRSLQVRNLDAFNEMLCPGCASN
jgi:eukaryotic-like serine/threonine-protein kinase